LGERSRAQRHLKAIHIFCIGEYDSVPSLGYEDPRCAPAGFLVEGGLGFELH